MLNLSCKDKECDGNDPRVAKLAALLRGAEQAHKQYEHARTLYAEAGTPESRASDPPAEEWPEFYAQNMLDNGAGLILCDGVMPHAYPGDVDCDALCGDSIALDG